MRNPQGEIDGEATRKARGAEEPSKINGGERHRKNKKKQKMI